MSFTTAGFRDVFQLTSITKITSSREQNKGQQDSQPAILHYVSRKGC
jgi:hypothetical protein